MVDTSDRGDPYQSTAHWAMLRFRRIASGWFFGDVVFGIVVGILARWAGATASTWFFLAYFVGGCITFAAVVYLFAFLQAPYQQRNLLRLIDDEKNERIAELETTLSNEDVGSDHSEALRQILEHAKSYVVGGQDVAFQTPYDKSAITDHFPEIDPALASWDEVAKEAARMERELKQRFDGEFVSQGFNIPSFNYPAFEFLLELVKHIATKQGLGEDQRVEWRDFDPKVPNLYLQNGTQVAQVDDTRTELVYENIQIRVQEFFNLMKTWPETKAFGDHDWLNAHNEKQKDLIQLLNARIIQFGFKRGNGCPQCPR
ncbi:MAG: hypothetical protein HIU84_10285 [Acidobacteria bacterium]|nr:hypothetical protein [Acidobacteriota bacterium]